MDRRMVDLKKLAGDKYRVTIESSYYAESGSTQKRNRDPYLWQVVGRHGDVFLWAPDRLAVSTHKRGGIARRLLDLPFTEVVQDGSDGVTVTFAAEHLDDVAQIVRLRRRPVLSDERRAELSERMKSMRREP
jgi:hypothetical protein